MLYNLLYGENQNLMETLDIIELKSSFILN